MAMTYGSSHVWDYGDQSPEEYLSDSELEGSSEEELEDSGMFSPGSATSHVPVGRTTSKESLLRLLRYQLMI